MKVQVVYELEVNSREYRELFDGDDMSLNDIRLEVAWMAQHAGRKHLIDRGLTIEEEEE